MRDIPVAALPALLAESSGHALLSALDVSGGPGGPTLHYVANTENVEVEGNTYVASGFSLTLAADAEDSVPQARVEIENVSRELVRLLREVDAPLDVAPTVLRVDEDGVASRLIGPLNYSLMAIDMDAGTISGTLGFELDFLNEPAVKDAFTPTLVPGLY
jgi:hypothetical protein